MLGTLLALDVGTHAARALIVSGRGEVLAAAARPLAIRRGRPGEVEQDPLAMLAAVRAAMDEALAGGAPRPERAGIAVQRSSVLCWDRDSRAPLSPILSWMDTRAAGRLVPLAPREEEIVARTGLRLSPHYGASKLAWALAALPAVHDARDAGRLMMGPLAAWLLAALCAESASGIDHANASRTLLWNLREREWDPELIAAFGLPGAALPASRPLRYAYGALAGTEIPVTAMSGDQNAAALADGPLPADCALVNLGTGAFLLRPVGASPRFVDRLLAGILDSDDAGASYLVEGTVNGAGAAFAWAEERWALAPLAPQLDALPAVADPPRLLNAVGGLGSPWWRHDQASRLEPASADEPAIAQAVVESILFLLRANLDHLRAAGLAPARLRVTGGLARSQRLCRGLADLCGLPLELPDEPEATARGIAWLAGGGPIDWRSAPSIRLEPRADPALVERYESWLAMMPILA